MPAFFRWLITLGFLASLPFMRLGWDLARERGGRAFADAIPLAAALVLVAAVVWRLAARWRQTRPSAYLFLAGICAASALLFRSLPDPIMRIHVAQYSLLSVLVFWSMLGEREGRIFCVWAALAASALGYADELVQGLIPSRIYDLQDVLLNAASAFLGQAVVLLVLRPWAGRGGGHPGAPRRRAVLPGIACAILLVLAIADAAIIEKGTPTLGGRGDAALRGRDGYRLFGPAAVAANAAAAAAAAALLAAAGRGLRGTARAIRSVALCALAPPFILIAGKLLGLRFR